jgi:hypothetical protein
MEQKCLKERREKRQERNQERRREDSRITLSSSC